MAMKNMKTLLFSFILIIIFHIRIFEGYRLVLIPKDNVDLCQNKTCEGGALHSYCFVEQMPANNCVGYVEIKMSNRRKLIIINGHNGIRNKLALRWNIANMLLLHWDRDLQHMAAGYLSRCIRAKDKCNFIYNETFTVDQAYAFYQKPPLNRFIISVMRAWYLEVNHIDTLDGFFKEKQGNMSAMTYPETQFVGCSAAEMFGGHMMVCYYSPAYDKTNPKAYIRGEPCTACPEERSSCSRVFEALCGLDTRMETGSKIQSTNLIFYLVLFWILQCLK